MSVKKFDSYGDVKKYFFRRSFKTVFLTAFFLCLMWLVAVGFQMFYQLGLF